MVGQDQFYFFPLLLNSGYYVFSLEYQKYSIKWGGKFFCMITENGRFFFLWLLLSRLAMDKLPPTRWGHLSTGTSQFTREMRSWKDHGKQKQLKSTNTYTHTLLYILYMLDYKATWCITWCKATWRACVEVRSLIKYVTIMAKFIVPVLHNSRCSWGPNNRNIDYFPYMMTTNCHRFIPGISLGTLKL